MRLLLCALLAFVAGVLGAPKMVGYGCLYVTNWFFGWRLFVLLWVIMWSYNLAAVKLSRRLYEISHYIFCKHIVMEVHAR